jgi:uncharacterized protein (DUF2236 family)
MDAAAGMIVGADDLARTLAQLEAGVADRRAGLFGPGSAVWRINREAVTFLGGGRAALLQLAHPAVAHAVDQHSSARADPLGRFVRTFDHVFAMVYGDLDAALASARRLHALHARVTGTVREDVGAWRAGGAYAANDVDALLWVHATLWDTSIQVAELVGGPLPDADKDAYWAETRRFAALFGIPDDRLPRDWSAFQAYVAAMLAGPTIAAGRVARELAHHLLRPPGTWIGPAWDWYAAVTASLLPARLRSEFALPWGPSEERLAARTLALVARTWRWLPERVRFLPAYVDAERRCAGRGPDPVARVVERVAARLRG